MFRVLLVSIVSSIGLMSSAWAADTKSFVGNWSCELIVDQTYSFQLKLQSTENGLGGTAENYDGAVALENVKAENDQLTFQINHPEVGVVDFKLALKEGKLKGTAGNYSFEGNLTCSLPAGK